MNAKELMLLKCGFGENTLESLGLQKIKPVNPKGNQSWVFIGMTDAEAETPTGKDSDAGKDWRQEEKGKEWDGWMASLTRWTWVWASSRSWWWTGKPGVLQPMGSQRVSHDWGTELTWFIANISNSLGTSLLVFLLTMPLKRSSPLLFLLLWPELPSIYKKWYRRSIK